MDPDPVVGGGSLRRDGDVSCQAVDDDVAHNRQQRHGRLRRSTTTTKTTTTTASNDDDDDGSTTTTTTLCIKQNRDPNGAGIGSGAKTRAELQWIGRPAGAKGTFPGQCAGCNGRFRIVSGETFAMLGTLSRKARSSGGSCGGKTVRIGTPADFDFIDTESSLTTATTSTCPRFTLRILATMRTLRGSTANTAIVARYQRQGGISKDGQGGRAEDWCRRDRPRQHRRCTE